MSASHNVRYDNYITTSDGFWCGVCKTSVSVPHEHLPQFDTYNPHRCCQGCGVLPWKNHHDGCKVMASTLNDFMVSG